MKRASADLQRPFTSGRTTNKEQIRKKEEPRMRCGAVCLWSAAAAAEEKEERSRVRIPSFGSEGRFEASHSNKGWLFAGDLSESN